MTLVVRIALLGAAVAVALSAIPVAAITGSFLAEHAVSQAMRKAGATSPDFLTLAAAPQPDTDGFAVDRPIWTAAR
jgi:hypothetical protein